MKLLPFLLMAVFPGVAFCQPTAPATLSKSIDSAVWYTAGFVNCRGWVAAPVANRLGVVVGIRDGLLIGISAAAPSDSGADQTSREWIARAATNGEIERGIDGLCGAPENAFVPIAYLFQIFTMQTKGTPPVDIGVRLAAFRKWSYDHAAQPKEASK